MEFKTLGPQPLLSVVLKEGVGKSHVLGDVRVIGPSIIPSAAVGNMNGMELRMIIEQIVCLSFDVSLKSDVQRNNDGHDIKYVIRYEMGLNGLELGLQVQYAGQELVVSSDDLRCS